MQKSEKSREFTRLSIPVKIEVKTHDSEPIAATALNISMSGVLLRSDRKLATDTPCEIHIILGENDPLVIVSHGKVLRSTQNELAVGFTEMDLNGFSHMKNLLLYNAPDANQIDEEFSSHIGLHKK